MARPFGTFKYRSVDELEAKIDEYFDMCDGTPARDDDGNITLDKHGNPLYKTVPKPYTLEGLALYLGISVRTLAYYSDANYPTNASNENETEENRHSYLQALEHARAKCLNYASERLFDKDGIQGAKFYAINNSERMGGLKYAERQEIDMNVQPIVFAGAEDLED